MVRPGDIIITTIITTGHRITGRHSIRLQDRQAVRQAARQAARPGRHRCHQEDNIAVSNFCAEQSQSLDYELKLPSY